MENQQDLQTTLKVSFQKVKEDIQNIQKTVQNITSQLDLIQQEIILLKEKTNYSPMEIKGFFRQTLDRHSTDTRQTLDNLSQIQPQIQSEAGDKRENGQQTNKPQINPKQQANQLTTTEQDIYKLSQTLYNQQKQENIPITISEKEIFDTFRSLTNKEFLTFLAIYQLEEELRSFVFYSDIAGKLKLSQSSVRDHVNELMLKKTPIEKRVLGNRKVSLSIRKVFKEMKLMDKILIIKNITPSEQKTLDNI